MTKSDLVAMLRDLDAARDVKMLRAIDAGIRTVIVEVVAPLVEENRALRDAVQGDRLEHAGLREAIYGEVVRRLTQRSTN